MKNIKPLLFIICAMFFSLQAHARFEAHEFTNERMEKDYGVLVQELRCLVCQNQNLADSNAELAQDMRLRVFKMLNEGSSREEIVDFMVERYGDFVIYRPPVNTSTFFLWFGPLIFFVVAAIVVVTTLRRQKTSQGVAIADDEKQKKAHSILEDE